MRVLASGAAGAPAVTWAGLASDTVSMPTVL